MGKKKSLQKRNGTVDQSANSPTHFAYSSTVIQDVETQTLGHEGGLRTGIWGKCSANFCL